jgi:hypothetical protein
MPAKQTTGISPLTSSHIIGAQLLNRGGGLAQPVDFSLRERKGTQMSSWMCL